MKFLFDIGYIATHIYRVDGVIYHMTWMRVAIYLVVMPFFCDLTKARNDRQTPCLLGVLVHNFGVVTKADLGSVSSTLEP